jgi:Tfp pilus assembly protein PilP
MKGKSTMLKKRMNEDVARSPKMYVGRITFQFLVCILSSLLGLPVVLGEVLRLSATNSNTVDGLVQGIQVKSDFKTRRDPFSPMKKPRSISSSSRKSHPDSPTITPVPTINNPNWKLLGIIHGQYGSQAVIQVSPRERVFVRTGFEVVQSGWTIKTISKDKVLLEHPSTSPSGKGLSEPKAFMLSFASLGKSS